MVAPVPKAVQLPPLSRQERRAAVKASNLRNDGRPMLSVLDAAVYLGMSPDTVYRIIRAGKLRTFKVEGTLRIRPSDLDAYLDENIAS